MKLQTLVETLYKELGLPGTPTPNAKGAYVVTFDEGIEVNVLEYPIFADNPHERGIALSTVITPCKEKGTGALYQAALLGNLFGVSTQQGILGLSANGKNLTLCREIEYNCDYIEFQDILEQFLNTVEIWRETAALQEQKAA